MVFKPRSFLNNEVLLSCSNVNDPRFVSSPKLLAGCIDLVSDCLLQASFEINISDVLIPGNEHAITAGRWYTSNKADDECVDQREINQRNAVNWRTWAAQVTMMCVTNGAF